MYLYLLLIISKEFIVIFYCADSAKNVQSVLFYLLSVYEIKGRGGGHFYEVCTKGISQIVQLDSI